MKRAPAARSATRAVLVAGAALTLAGILLKHAAYIDELLVPAVYSTLVALYVLASLIPRKSGARR